MFGPMSIVVLLRGFALITLGATLTSNIRGTVLPSAMQGFGYFVVAVLWTMAESVSHMPVEK